MTKKVKSIISLVSACVLLVVGIVCAIVASINGANKYKGIDYSHNITIENVRTEPATIQGIVYHYVSLTGGVRNCTDSEVELDVIIVFEGIDNVTGEKNEYKQGLVLGEVKPNQTVVLKEDEISVGNDKGFYPEKIKRVEIISDNGESYRAVFKDESDGNIILFGISLVCLLLAVVFGARWISEFLKERKEKLNNGDKIK